MHGNPQSSRSHLSPTLAQVVDPVCDRFEAAWKAAGKDGLAPSMQDYLSGVEEPARSVLLRELLALEVSYRRRRGEQPTPAEYRDRFPGQDTLLDSLWAEGGAPAQPGPSLVPIYDTIYNDEAIPLPKPMAGWPSVPGYQMLKELGEGGMGVVYLARHLPLDRLVALKTLRLDIHFGPETLTRFRAEAASLARLRHPNIVQVHEVGETGDRPYFAMEFCAGGNLKDRLGGKPLPPKEAARLVETLARAMHAAHEQKVVHRDLKPANVLFSADGTAKVSDFGLVKRLDVAGQTQSVAILGTASYMPPEQAKGQSREVGPAADVYSLGAILYEMLTGRPPFVAPTLRETLNEVIADEPVPPRRLQSKTPRDLETICLKCLEKRPERRYATALKLAEELRRFQRNEPIVARPASALYRLGKFAQRNKGLVAGTALVLFAFVAGVIVASVCMVWVLTADATAKQEHAEKVAAKATEAQALNASQRSAMKVGDWQESLKIIKQIQDIPNLDSAALHLDTVRALCALNELPLANKELQDLSQRADLGDLEGQVLLRQADLALNRSWHDDQALQKVRQALEKKLPPAEEAYARGLLARTTPEAVDCFQQALRIDPVHQRANGMLSLLLILLGRFPEASNQITIAESLFPMDPSFRLLHALLEALQGHADAANQQLDRVKPQLNPNQLKAAQAFLDLAGQAPKLAKFLSDDPNLSVASAVTQVLPHVAAVQSAFSEPDADLFLPVPPVLNEALQGVSLVDLLLNPDSLLKELDHAATIHPDGLLLLWRGMLRTKKDDKEGWTAAEKDFMAASQGPSIIPIQRRALYMAAAAEWVLDREHGPQPEMRQQSLQNLRKIVAQGGFDVDQFDTVVVMAAKMEDYDLARYVLDEWARQAPDNPEMLQRRVEVEVMAGSYRSAIDVIDHILAKKPGPEEMQAWKTRREKTVAKLRDQAEKVPPPSEDPGKSGPAVTKA